MNGSEVRREWFEKDYYKTLGVAKNASAGEIKRAYRKLAQRFHPDANPGNKEAEERFKEISGAYDVLGDAEKRRQYDQVREMAASGVGAGGFPGGGRGPAGRGGGFPFGGDIGDFGDIFSGLFRGARREPVRGDDLEAEVRISFQDAMHGTTVPIKIRGPAPCQTCGGSGAAPGTSPVTCPQCGGTGSVAQNQGLFSFARPCPRCGGAGRIVEHPCPTCKGSGNVRRTRSFSVRVPAGVRDGARIRIGGRGEPGARGGRSGDLYVVVHVAAHEVFGRRGSDLTVEVPITFAEAALGATVGVPTLDGSVRLKVPAGTPSGKTFRLKGRGAPRPRGGAGDLLVTVRVEVPTKVSKQERELLERLASLQGRSPRGRLGVEA